MSVVFHKKPTSVIHTSASKPSSPMNAMLIVKPIIVLLCLALGIFLLLNWQSILQGLDKNPIRAYALTHQTRFTTDADIRGALTKEPALKGYFGQDIQEVKQKLLNIPWVKEVTARKMYPDRLSITLLEHTPVAIWNSHSLLSEQGVVFSLPKDRFNSRGLPILFGPDEQGKVVLEAWTKIKRDLETRQLGLRSVSMDNRGAWIILLDNGVELRLGRGDWLPKIDRFVTIFPEIDIPEGKMLTYVDLRYEYGAAVGFINK
ncbi:cell division protein FtsQ [Nicoletella semolina]|uniref:Cell division protein FtsQ n=1 Tax=Nicoletella semolina TaxID=271160 RepID=A0A4R2N956_9PAST|nr:cell division protein FtsQ/DivIB [Nicoletella semolina]MDH2924441.1 cell division protein FtsQ [Nicoletella semolina]TCP17435.1 cell division protein FtsQ [Nicoletella semolina]